MKKSILIAVAFLFIIGMGTAPVFAGDSQTVTIEHDNHGVPDPLTFEQFINGKNDEDLIIKGGLRIKEIVKFNKNFWLDIFGGKDVHRTNAKEGWYVGGEGVIRWTLADFSKK